MEAAVSPPARLHGVIINNIIIFVFTLFFYFLHGTGHYTCCGWDME
jgi:hypothetical protein